MSRKREEPRWVERLVVEAIQFDVVRTYGGMQGLRDENGLESALARTKRRFTYEPKSDLAALAAAYGFGLARNRAFNDGNKRVAFVTMGVFLGLNGFEIDAPEAEVVTVMLDLAARVLNEGQLADWVRSRLTPQESGNV